VNDKKELLRQLFFMAFVGNEPVEKSHFMPESGGINLNFP